MKEVNGMGEYAMEMRNISKSFGNVQVLKNISLKLKKGEVLGLVGENGAGKSTMMNVLGGIYNKNGGEILIDGKPYNPSNPKDATTAGIAFVQQELNLFTNLTVMENLILAPIKLKIMSREKAEKRAMELLRHIGLTKKVNAYPASLSGGQKQRVAIIRAMMLSPEVLLFDEPTSALDPESIGDVLSLIRELAERGMTIMIVTHEMNFAKEIATRIVFLDKGKIIEEGAPKEFFEHPKTDRVKEFLKKI